MDEWQTCVSNQKRLSVSSPKLVCIDIQPEAYSICLNRQSLSLLTSGNLDPIDFQFKGTRLLVTQEHTQAGHLAGL